MMLAQFQARYPTGSLISELLTIYQGKFVVRVLAQVEGVTRATGMAAAETLELAEDRARSRALEVMAIDQATPQLPATTPTQAADQQMLEPPLTGKISPQPIKQTQPSFSIDSTDQSSAPGYSSLLKTPLDEEVSAFAPASPVKESTPATVSSAGIKSKRDFVGKDNNQSFNLNSTPSEQSQLDFEDFGITSDIQTSSSGDLPTSSSNVTPFVPRSYSSQASVKELDQIGTAPKINESEPLDLSDVIAQTDVELARLKWSKQKGRDHLLQTYNKRSRQQLDKDELLEFLDYLKSQPSP